MRNLLGIVAVCALVVLGCDDSKCDTDGHTCAADSDASHDAAEPEADASMDASSEDASDDARAPLSDARVDESEPDAGDAGDAGPGRKELIEVAIDVSAMVADVERGRLYASVPSSAPEHANHVVVLDAVEGTLLHAVPMAVEPSALALSDDGTTLWVSFELTSELQRVDVSGDEPMRAGRLSVPHDDLDMIVHAKELVVLPGTTESLAISQHNGLTPSLAGVVVIDDGEARSARAPRHAGAAQLILGPEGYLFGADDGFYTLQLDDEGITSQTRLTRVLGGRFVYDSDGFVYFSRGDVIDVREPDAPRYLGALPYAGAPAPVPDSDLVLLVSPTDGTSGPLVLRKLDTDTLTQSSAEELGPSAESWWARDALLVAPTTLAFVGATEDSSHVFIVHDPELSEAPQVSRPELEPIEQGDLVELPLEARGLVADRARGRLYASVGGRAASYPNSLVTLDGESGEVLGSRWVGSEPSALALSDDGSTLWVALAGSSELREVDVSGAAAELGELYAMPAELGERPALDELAMLAGTTDRVAIAARRSDELGTNDLVLFDAGVAQIVGAPEWIASHLAAGPTGYLLAFDALSGDDLLALAIGEAGVTSVERSAAYTSGFRYDRDGIVYFETGEVVDFTDPMAPALLGDFRTSGALFPIEESDAVVMLSCDEVQGLVLQALSTDTLMDTSMRALDTGEHELCVTSNVAVFGDDTVFFTPEVPFDASSVYMLKTDALF